MHPFYKFENIQHIFIYALPNLPSVGVSDGCRITQPISSIKLSMLALYLATLF